MKLGGIGPLELGIILLVVLLIFGPKNLPKLGSAIGKGVKNLREGIGSAKEDEPEQSENVVAGEIVEEAPAPAAQPAAAAAGPAPQAEAAPKKKVVKKVVKKEVQETE